MSKIIGFFGSYPADICMYAAYALQNAGRRVCVIDNSEDGILYQSVPTPDQRLDAVTFHNVDFMRWEPLVQWHELDYEFVLVQLGNEPQELCLALCSMRILIIDCERRNLDFYHQFMQESSLPAAVLLRGFCPDQMAVAKMKKRFEQGNAFIDQWLLLPFDEADETYRIEMQYGWLYKFVHISAGMERILMQLLRMMEIHDRIRIIRAVRDAKQGKTAGHIYAKSGRRHCVS